MSQSNELDLIARGLIQKLGLTNSAQFDALVTAGKIYAELSRLDKRTLKILCIAKSLGRLERIKSMQHGLLSGAGYQVIGQMREILSERTTGQT